MYPKNLFCCSCTSSLCLFHPVIMLGHLPSAWKSANITALCEKGAKNDPLYDRPFSLFPIIRKIMESIITVDMKSFFFSNYLISHHQFRFRPGHSNLDMLLLLTQQWMEALNVRHEIKAISLVISLAFDAVWYILPYSPNSLLMASKVNSTRGLLTPSTLIANV